MAKKDKASKPKKTTPSIKAYRLVLGAIEEKYDEYSDGEADDDEFGRSPAKQKKIAKQLAKHHNRVLKKSKLDDVEPLDEEVE